MANIFCAECGINFQPKSGHQKYCSDRCRYRAKDRGRTVTCAACGDPMQRGGKHKPGISVHMRCPRQGAREEHGSYGYHRGCRCGVCTAAKAARSAAFNERYRAENGESYSTAWRRAFREEHGYWPQRTDFISGKDRKAIYERDGWICQLCGDLTDPTLDHNSDLYPSLDHIIPRSRQLVPDHSAGNLRTAHRICNSKRGAREA